MKDLSWFQERIGRRIYRDAVSCGCTICKSGTIHGVFVFDENHAQYLFDCQNEIGIRYRDEL